MSTQHIVPVRPVRVTEDRRVEYPSTDKFIDYFARTTQRHVVPGEVLELIDFTRPYDKEYFARLVQPQEAFVDLVDWSVEPGSQPPWAAGAKQVAKLRIEPGETVYVRIPVFLACAKPVVLFTCIYVPSEVTADAYFVLGGNLASNRTKLSKTPVGRNDWARILKTWFYEQNNGGLEVVLEFKNTGTDTKYVYVAYIIVCTYDLRNCTTVPLIIVSNLEITLSNESIDVVLANPPFTVLPSTLFIDSWTTIAGDDTNALSVSLIVAGTTLVTASRTSSTYGTVTLTARVKLTMVNPSMVIKYTYSTSGTGKIVVIIVWARFYGDVPRYTRRVSGDYTSDGDGAADVVTILNYTEQVKHISRLLRVVAKGDSNTTELKLRVDGIEVWDFLNDGDTCTLEIRDAKKVELVVNDPGGGTTTTVSYVVQFEEEYAHLVK